MSYLRYLRLFSYSGVQHILCCFLALFFFVLCVLCCRVLWNVHFLLSLRYSLAFIYKNVIIAGYLTEILLKVALNIIKPPSAIKIQC
jgi:hypothetical protein